jgi:ubiquinone/menaquinone biosynthesis C-methylase UbiE
MAQALEKPRQDSPINGLLASWYARTTRRDLDEFRKLAVRVAEQLPPGTDVLDVAPGPGYWAIELAKLGHYHVQGLDLSADFVRIAAQHARQSGATVEFHHGNVAQMPFAAESFDFLMCRAAFKNFADPRAALKEMHRVLRPTGKALIIDLRNDATIEDVYNYVDSMHLGVVNSRITKLIFRHFLLKRAYSIDDFRGLAGKSPFRSAEIHKDGICVEVCLTR